jgi:hypothetical protein
VKARIVSNPKAITPGGVLSVRIENPGTTSILYGVALRVEQWTLAGWREPPGPEIFWPPTATTIEAGGTGRCERLRLNDDLETGRYRVSKEVDAGKKTLTVYAPFTVQ